MSYNKTTWQAGDTITAEKLNNIETGIEAADKPVYAPETVTGEGDVSVIYNGNQVGVLSDTGMVTLHTENTIVEHNIGIEYMKPAGGLTFPQLSITNNADAIFNTNSAPIIINGSECYYVGDSPDTATNYIAAFGHGEYRFDMTIESDSDNLVVVANGETISYDGIGHQYFISFTSANPNEMPDITITINTAAQ